MYIPVSVSSAKFMLNNLDPKEYVVGFIDDRWCLVDELGTVLCSMLSDREEHRRLVEFFSRSPHIVDDLLSYIKELRRTITAQDGVIKELNDKASSRKELFLQREVDKFRIDLNRALMLNEQLIKELKYLRARERRSA